MEDEKGMEKGLKRIGDSGGSGGFRGQIEEVPTIESAKELLRVRRLDSGGLNLPHLMGLSSEVTINYFTGEKKEEVLMFKRNKISFVKDSSCPRTKAYANGVNESNREILLVTEKEILLVSEDFPQRAVPISQTLSRARYTSVVVSLKLAMRQVENDVGGHAFLGNSSILPFVTVVPDVFGLIRAHKKNKLNRSMDTNLASFQNVPDKCKTEPHENTGTQRIFASVDKLSTSILLLSPIIE
ncbi:hypothetical protein HZH66_002384 [Vespula vulgaris]|uniref:Uncharacterized protein n=1 Tax=Vespula vulgaris TaxID=7454 RepID=A0A834KL02_VESVU|nr:hypothetical protein HZH66_002384 [Vespula vulgaris]